jgi:hypothetical protein
VGFETQNFEMLADFGYDVSKYTNRQYSCVGTGTATIQGSTAVEGPWETFLTIAPGGATTRLSQRSADIYPFVRVTKSGTVATYFAGQGW